MMLMPVAGRAHRAVFDEGLDVLGANDLVNAIGRIEQSNKPAQNRQSKEVEPPSTRQAASRGSATPRFYGIKIDGTLLAQCRTRFSRRRSVVTLLV